MGRTQIDKIFPRTSCLNMSDMLPGPRVKGVHPQTPDMMRKTIIIGKLVDLAQATLKRINPRVEM
jgi:hypothetical protein